MPRDIRTRRRTRGNFYRRPRRRRAARRRSVRYGPKRIYYRTRRQGRRLRHAIRHPRRGPSRQQRRFIGHVQRRQRHVRRQQHRAFKRTLARRRQRRARGALRRGTFNSRLGGRAFEHQQARVQARTGAAYLRRAEESGIRPSRRLPPPSTDELSGRLRRFVTHEGEAVARFEEDRARREATRKYRGFFGKVQKYTHGSPAGDLLSLFALSQDPEIQRKAFGGIGAAVRAASRRSMSGNVQSGGPSARGRAALAYAGRHGLEGLASAAHFTGTPGRKLHRALGRPGGPGTQVIFETLLDPTMYVGGGASSFAKGGRAAFREARALERVAPELLERPRVQRMVQQVARGGRNPKELHALLRRYRVRAERHVARGRPVQPSSTQRAANLSRVTSHGGAELTVARRRPFRGTRRQRYALPKREVQAAGDALARTNVREAVRRPGLSLRVTNFTGAQQIRLPFVARPVDLRGLEAGYTIPLKHPISNKVTRLPLLVGRPQSFRGQLHQEFAGERVMEQFRPQIERVRRLKREAPGPGASEEGRVLGRAIQRELSRSQAAAGTGRLVETGRMLGARAEARQARTLQLQAMRQGRISSGHIQRMTQASISPLLREHRTVARLALPLGAKPSRELTSALARVETHLRAAEADIPRSLLPGLRSEAEETTFRNLRASYDEMLTQGRELGFINSGRRNYTPRFWEGLGFDEPSLFAARNMGRPSRPNFAKPRSFHSIWDRGDPDAVAAHLAHAFPELDPVAVERLTQDLWSRGSNRLLGEVHARRLSRGHDLQLDDFQDMPASFQALRDQLDPQMGVLGEREGRLFLREDLTDPEQERAMRQRFAAAGARPDTVDRAVALGDELTANERLQAISDDLARVESNLRAAEESGDTQLADEYRQVFDQLAQEAHAGTPLASVFDPGLDPAAKYRRFLGRRGEEALRRGQQAVEDRRVAEQAGMTSRDERVHEQSGIDEPPPDWFGGEPEAEPFLSPYDEVEAERWRQVVGSIRPELREVRGSRGERLTYEVRGPREFGGDPQIDMQYLPDRHVVEVNRDRFDLQGAEGMRRARQALMHEIAHARTITPSGLRVLRDAAERLTHVRDQLVQSLRPEMTRLKRTQKKTGSEEFEGQRYIRDVPDMPQAIYQLVNRTHSLYPWSPESLKVIRKMGQFERNSVYAARARYVGWDQVRGEEISARLMELMSTDPKLLQRAVGRETFQFLRDDVLKVQLGWLKPVNPDYFDGRELLISLDDGTAWVRGSMDNVSLQHRPNDMAMGYVTKEGRVRTWHESQNEEQVVYHESMAAARREHFVARLNLTPDGKVTGIHGDQYHPDSTLDDMPDLTTSTDEMVRQRIEDTFGPGQWTSDGAAFQPWHRGIASVGEPEESVSARALRQLEESGQELRDLPPQERPRYFNRGSEDPVRWGERPEERPPPPATVDDLTPGPWDDPMGPGGGLPDFRGTRQQHPVTDPRLTNFYRSSAQGRAAAFRTQWRTVDEKEGRWVHDPRLERTGDGYRDRETGTEFVHPEVAGINTGVSDGRLWPARVVHEATAEFNRYYDWETLQREGAAALTERFLTQVRWSVTSPFPAYHARNMASDMLKSLQADSGVLFHPISNAILTHAAFGGRAGHVTVPGIGRMELPDFLLFADSFGIRTGEHIADFGRVVGENPKMDISTGRALGRRFQRATLQFGSRREDVMRMVTFVQRMRRNNGDAADAMWYTIRHHFDYGDLGRFERRTIRNVLLFYTWYRKNIPLQLAELGRRPGFFTAVYHNYEAVAEGRQPAINQDWPRITGIPFLPDTSGGLPHVPLQPDYITERLAGLGLNWNGHATYLGFGAPWADLGMVQSLLEPKEGLGQLAAMTQPGLAALISWVGQKNLLTGQEFREREPGPFAEILASLGVNVAKDRNGRALLPWWVNVVGTLFPGAGRAASPFQAGSGWNQAGDWKGVGATLTGVTPWSFPERGTPEFRNWLDMGASIEYRKLTDYIDSVRNLDRKTKHRLVKQYVNQNVKRLPRPVQVRMARRVTASSKHLSDRERLKKLYRMRESLPILYEGLTPSQRKRREEKRSRPHKTNPYGLPPSGGGSGGSDLGLPQSGVGFRRSPRREGPDWEPYLREQRARRVGLRRWFHNTRDFPNPFDVQYNRARLRRWYRTPRGREWRRRRKIIRRRQRHMLRRHTNPLGGGARPLPRDYRRS